MSRRSFLPLLLAPWYAGARAQPVRYPTRPVTLVVPFAPGGIADLTARLVAEAMGTELGQPIVVDNRPSAGSVVGASAVAHARPDGYTLLLMSNAQAVSASLFRKLPFDASTAFAPITTLGFFDLGVFAAPSKYATLADALADARARPGKLNLGTIAIGSTQHLAAELFKTTAGIDALVVPYKASPAVLAALRSGEVDLAFEIMGPMLPQLSARTVRALAVTAAQRLPVAPQVPTAREAGLAHYEVASWNALAAPAGTPADVIERLNREARAAIAAPAMRERLQALGVRPETGSPQALAELLARETRRWREVIRAARIEPQ